MAANKAALLSAIRRHRSIIESQGVENALARAEESELKEVWALTERHGKEPNQENLGTALAVIRGEREAKFRASRLRTFKTALGLTGRLFDEDLQLQKALEMSKADQGTPVFDDDQEHGPALIPADLVEAQREWDIDSCMMSGAVHEDDKIKRRNSNDATVCDNSFASMLEHMPFNIVNRKDLVNGAISDVLNIPKSKILWRIDPTWRTTVLGVKKALEEQESFDNFGTDDSLIGCLTVRGGFIDDYTRVEYPENIIPCSEDVDELDVDYWSQVFAQGNVSWVWNNVLGDLSIQQTEDNADSAVKDGSEVNGLEDAESGDLEEPN
ncbi:uncharacterized protein AB675_6314 [Cyphellophora attinorum]|uniref:Uncharacterized protein n=1 Tax=Cyphellophora attinorum TaxID=1664694 RepID=A0A0N1HFD5_9EURO|nr:uncharacterized protein AB675_6314 [Phialophora attinorum]KPI43890.1 hypothetical protein AB675_6314 [Phialophora attinorum]